MYHDFKDIDLELEKAVFLFNSLEGNPGIYELIWELAYYNLTIEDKYKIARKLLLDLLNQDFCSLEKYSDFTLQVKIETVPTAIIDQILDKPDSWYPCNEVYSITLTQKGKEYFKNYKQKNNQKLADRLFKKTNKT